MVLDKSTTGHADWEHMTCHSNQIPVSFLLTIQFGGINDSKTSSAHHPCIPYFLEYSPSLEIKPSLELNPGQLTHPNQ